ncbi:MAG: acyl carrier protein [Rubrivivax sp.]|jgi:acyl carrier protein|nr:acyl carrier protein [Rubrivivax sp.]
MSTLQEQLRHFIQHNFLLGPRAARFTNQDSLIELGIMDSTGYLELIDHLEQAFQLRIEDHEMTPENLETLDRMATFLERKGARSHSSHGAV